MRGRTVKHLILILILLLSSEMGSVNPLGPMCWSDFSGGGEPFPLGDKLDSLWSLNNKSFSHPLLPETYFRFQLKEELQSTSFVVTLHDAQTHLEMGTGKILTHNNQSEIALEITGQSVSFFFHLRSFYLDHNTQEEVLVLNFMDLLDPVNVNCLSTIKLQEFKPQSTEEMLPPRS